MIILEPKGFALTIGGAAPIDLTIDQAKELCASLMAVLPTPAHSGPGCSEETPYAPMPAPSLPPGMDAAQTVPSAEESA